ncbi:MAG: UBP-type zinc finger domain-containing protein [Chloroflexota bacterium]
MADYPPIDTSIPPSGTGCVECLATEGGWWFHLRRCVHCGHIGCCDQSPSQHGSKHAAAENHPIIRSFEPGEDWFYDYVEDEYAEGPELAPPDHHPLSQPTPGPAGRAPRARRRPLPPAAP